MKQKYLNFTLLIIYETALSTTTFVRSESLGTLLAVGGLFVYGVEPLLIESNPTDPVSFATLSALFTSVLLAPFAAFDWRKNNVPLTPAKLGKASLVGLFGTTLAYLAYAAGTKLSTPVNAAVLTRSEVLWSFLLSWVFLRERITTRLAACSTLILLGGTLSHRS